MREFQVCSMT